VNKTIINIELITNDHHNNELATYKFNLKGRKYIRKVALSKQANALIHNENKGHTFYKKITGLDYNIDYNCSEFFRKITIPQFQGRIFQNQIKHILNDSFVDDLMKVYSNFIVNKNDTIINGDFALTNLVVNSDRKIYIFDWEHFHLAESIYWGFDFIHLLFLTIQRKNRLNKRESSFLKYCIQTFASMASPNNQLFEKPFVNSKKYMINNYKNFKLNIPIERKFELANCPKNILEFYDSLVT